MGNNGLFVFLKKDCFTLTSLTYFFYFWSWMTTIDSGIKGSNRRNERSHMAKICWPKIYLWKEKSIPSYGHMEVGDIKIHFKKGQPERQQRSSHHSNKYRNSKNQQHEGWTLSAAAHRTQLCYTQHITAGCNAQTLTAYAERYNHVVEIVYRNICVESRLQIPKSQWNTSLKWLERQHRILWDFKFQTHKQLLSNQPDVVVAYKEQMCDKC